MILNEFESFLTTSNHIKCTQNKFPAILTEFIPDHKKIGVMGSMLKSSILGMVHSQEWPSEDLPLVLKLNWFWIWFWIGLALNWTACSLWFDLELDLDLALKTELDLGLDLDFYIIEIFGFGCEHIGLENIYLNENMNIIWIGFGYI